MGWLSLGLGSWWVRGEGTTLSALGATELTADPLCCSERGELPVLPHYSISCTVSTALMLRPVPLNRKTTELEDARWRRSYFSPQAA